MSGVDMTITWVPGEPVIVDSFGDATGTATATCPPDAILVGGGGTANGTDFGDPSFDANVVGSWPSEEGLGGTWSYRATRAPGIEGGGPFDVTAYAMCAS